jgi:hypothetical protein
MRRLFGSILCGQHIFACPFPQVPFLPVAPEAMLLKVGPKPRNWIAGGLLFQEITRAVLIVVLG